MKFIIEVGFPPEPFNIYVREGTVGEKIGEVFGAIKPEVFYFTDSGVGRGAMMIVDLDSAAQAPHVTEPRRARTSTRVEARCMGCERSCMLVLWTPDSRASAGLPAAV